jgi:hypothetical protein
MSGWNRIVTLVVVLIAAALGAAGSAAQEAAEGADAPPPPEVQKLIDLAKDPERLREVMSDPQKIQEIMATMESDAVREFMSDPRRVQQLMREIDPQQIREAMRSVDFSKVRQAAAMRWKARLKQQLGVTDEEWKVLEPRIENLVRARQEAGVRPGGGRSGGRSGFGAGELPVEPRRDERGEPSELQEAAAELRAAMDDPDAPDADVRGRLDVYRRAREKARLKVETAERELKDLLTLRQEAILMLWGILS